VHWQRRPSNASRCRAAVNQVAGFDVQMEIILFKIYTYFFYLSVKKISHSNTVSTVVWRGHHSGQIAVG
jgi:hypothetical protein